MGCTCSHHRKPAHYQWQPEEGEIVADEQYWKVLQDTRVNILDKLQGNEEVSPIDLSIAQEWVQLTKERDATFRRIFVKAMEQEFVVQLHRLQQFLDDALLNLPPLGGTGLVPDTIKRKLLSLRWHLRKLMETDDVKQELLAHNQNAQQEQHTTDNDTTIVEWQKRSMHVHDEADDYITDMARNYRFKVPPQLMNDSANFDELLDNPGRTTPDSIVSFESAYSNLTTQSSNRTFANKFLSLTNASNRVLLAGQIAGFATENQNDLD